VLQLLIHSAAWIIARASRRNRKQLCSSWYLLFIMQGVLIYTTQELSQVTYGSQIKLMCLNWLVLVYGF